MGFMDRIKKVTGSDNYEDAYEDDYYNEFDGYSDADNDQMNTQGVASAQTQSGISGVSAAPAFSSYSANAGISLSGNALAMMVVKPEHFDSASQIADHLLNNCTVVLNLENTNKETARRLIDFLSGVAYSINGSLKKISSHVYVITPNNVDIGEARVNSAKADDTAAQASDPVEEAADEFGKF